MDLTKLTIEQLKALAYDNIVEFEMRQNNLKVINEELARRRTEPVKTEPKKK